MARKLALPQAVGFNSTFYEAIGGCTAFRRLSEAFYARVARDPVLRPLFPGKSFTCAIEEFTAFLTQFFGGPSEHSQRRWWVSLRESHLRFKIGPGERAAWIKTMIQAFDDVQFEEPYRTELLEFFRRSSAHVVNQGAPPDGVKPKDEAADNGPRAEIGSRWEAQLLLDEMVAAIRRGDTDRALALTESPAFAHCGPSVRAGLLAMMIRSGLMLDHVRKILTTDPAMARQYHAGRTLLHESAAAGSLSMVELLLSLGADPDTRDNGGHTPLYYVGNECAMAGSGNVIRALVRAGATVDANEGVKHCTALHMAARRGHTEVAAALLDCGANIEAHDSLGETPLRRAVNCDKVELASLLLARGADAHSFGSKRLTPLLAARSAAMKRALQMAGTSTA